METNLVIIPTYNEKENVEKIIRTIFSLKTPFEILIIDDNSPDKSAEIVKKLQKEFPQNLHLIERSGKLGLGTAYLTGFKWALDYGADYIYEMDCDFSHKPKDLERLHDSCTKDNADAAIGSRYINGINVINWPLGRVLMSYFASVYVRLVTRMKIMDTTAGFMCYSKKVLETIDLDRIHLKGYGFQIEMKFTAWKHGFNLIEVPIIFMDRQKGTSKMSGGIFTEAFTGIPELKIRSWFRKYKQANKTNK